MGEMDLARIPTAGSESRRGYKENIYRSNEVKVLMTEQTEALDIVKIRATSLCNNTVDAEATIQIRLQVIE